ncbi:MAG: hypothetical protein ACLQUZ_05125 [Rhizomicrobium sp.]
MSRPATIELDGRRYLWREIVERRRRQIAAHDAAQARQLTLFERKHDTRPATQRTAAGRYAEPTLFAALDRSPA